MPQSDSAVSVFFPEQQDSMATTVAVSPSEYLQPSTTSTQVSTSQMSRPTAVSSLAAVLFSGIVICLTHGAFKLLLTIRTFFMSGSVSRLFE